jgi:hypothetical protein
VYGQSVCLWDSAFSTTDRRFWGLFICKVLNLKASISVYMKSYVSHRYVGFCVLDNSEAVLVTDRHVCVHEYLGLEEKWTCEVRELADVEVEQKNVMVTTARFEPVYAACMCVFVCEWIFAYL